jgi:NADPH:quinone reductase-like Zn-dependent oxidoreductase
LATENSRAFWIAGPKRCEIRTAPLGALAPGHVRVRTRLTGISRGTERLVHAGAVPTSEFERMRAPFQQGGFDFPVKYGYCALGTVVAGEGLAPGTRIFALHPHQDVFDVPAAAALPVPDDVPDAAVPLAAHLETALNALWDHPARVGDRVAVVGLGAIGLCLARLLASVPGIDLAALDPSSAARARAGLPSDCADDRDLVFHCSGTAAGLAKAVALAGFEATVVEMSWYGDRDVPVALGGAFHSRRLTLAASQVGAVSPSRRATRSHADRLALALRLLAEPRFQLELGAPVPFDSLPDRYAALLDSPDAPPLPLVSYR